MHWIKSNGSMNEQVNEVLNERTSEWAHKMKRAYSNVENSYYICTHIYIISTCAYTHAPANLLDPNIFPKNRRKKKKIIIYLFIQHTNHDKEINFLSKIIKSYRENSSVFWYF